MADNRDLRHGEKRLAMFTAEKGRDRANAQRMIEGLSQGDAQIQLLTDIAGSLQTMASMKSILLERQDTLIAEQQHTNELLRWVGQQPGVAGSISP